MVKVDKIFPNKHNQSLCNTAVLHYWTKFDLLKLLPRLMEGLQDSNLQKRRREIGFRYYRFSCQYSYIFDFVTDMPIIFKLPLSDISFIFRSIFQYFSNIFIYRYFVIPSDTWLLSAFLFNCQYGFWFELSVRVLYIAEREGKQ